jgi:hypothetical protein
MKVKPVLGDWEIPHIESIRASETRSFVELPVPGMTGSLFQDMSAKPARMEITGSIYGDEQRNAFLESLREKFNEGEPVTFVADIVTATEVQYVIIERLHFEEVNTHPDETKYSILLRESPPPPPPSTLGGLDIPDGLDIPGIEDLGDIDLGLLDEAGGFLDSVTGALDMVDMLGSVPDIGDPTPPLTDALSGVTDATKDIESVLSPLTDIFGTDED